MSIHKQHKSNVCIYFKRAHQDHWELLVLTEEKVQRDLLEEMAPKELMEMMELR